MTNAKRSLLISVLVLLVFAFTFSSQAHAAIFPKLEWIRSYSNPVVMQDLSLDIGYGLSLDSTGNVYVTGISGQTDNFSDVWIRKYDASGNVIWTSTYDSPYHWSDQGRGIAVSLSGDVYVAGGEWRYDLGELWNVWLGKYDMDGNNLWTRTYDSPTHRDDIAYDVSVDMEGNAYVVGSEGTTSSNEYIWLRKYDSNGDIVWTKTRDVNYRGFASSVDVDANGNVYVTGQRIPYELYYSTNKWVCKYDSDGNLQWTQSIENPSSHYDCGYGVVVDDSGNVYATGFITSMYTGEGKNIWVAKYDANGALQWMESIDGGNEGDDYGKGVAVDKYGNVYVTGSINIVNDGHGDIWVRKFDPDGNVLWTTTYDNPSHPDDDRANDIEIDIEGNIYVVGYEYRGDLDQFYNIVLLKYAQVPEPSTLLLLAPGLFSFAALLRKKFRSVEVKGYRS